MSIPVYSNYKCPFCKARVDAFKHECGSCGQDVSLLSDLHLLPYSLVNQGLERLAKGDKWGALVKVCAAVEFDQKFERGRHLLADLASELGLEELARIYRQSQSP